MCGNKAWDSRTAANSPITQSFYQDLQKRSPARSDTAVMAEFQVLVAPDVNTDQMLTKLCHLSLKRW